MVFKEISNKELQVNPLTVFGCDWALAAAGNEKDGFNVMTITWGQLGSIWDRKSANGKTIIPTASVFIRPQRYTKQYIDKEELFSISTFDPTYKRALGYMGSHSGRDEDKIAAAGLTPLFIEGTTGFEEARMIFVCKKIYQDHLREQSFLEKKIITDNYPEKDFHEMYIGEILKIFVPYTEC